MQAASMVTASAGPRNKADNSIAKPQDGGQGANAFADLLNTAEERGETNESDAAGSAAPQKTITRARKVERPLVEGGSPAGEAALAHVGSAKALAEAALKGEVRATAEADKAVDADAFGSLADTEEVSEVDRKKGREEMPGNSELVAWLAGLIPTPAAAQEVAESKPLQQAGAAGPARSIPGHLPGGVAVAGTDEQARDEATPSGAKPASSARNEKLQDALPAQSLAEVQAKPAGTPTADAAAKASLQPASAEPVAPSTLALIKPLSPEPTASQPQTTTPVFGAQSLNQNAPAAQPPSGARPYISTSSDKLEEALPAPSLAEVQGKPAGTLAADAVGKASSEPAAPSSPAPIKQLQQEYTTSQTQTATPILGAQSLREPSPATPPPSAARSEAFVQPSVHSPAFAPAFSARIATLARDGLELARVHLNPVDMGPVSVQLSLDGQQVRVDMTADVAATRRVLEQALPSLAGALREAGFTLSGGGVYQPATDARSGSTQDSGSNPSANPQGAATADSLGTSAGGAGGQGPTGNPFRQDPQAQGSFAASRLVTMGEDTPPSADVASTSTTVRQATGLVDVFA